MKIRFLYLYLIFLIYLGLLALLLFTFSLNNTGFGITLAFLSLILFPGVLILRLIRPKIPSFLMGLIYSFALGFCFYFLFNLAAIILNLTIWQLLWAISIGLLILYGIAFVRDFQEKVEINLQDYLKNKTWADWLWMAILLGASILAFLAIDAQSDKIFGDGWFHLSILQKITGGEGLSSSNLWIEKTSQINLVYSFPVWHILVGVFGKILNISIFTAWRQVLLPLAIFALITWYGLAQIIFKNRLASGLVYLAFLLIFLKDDTFYFFVALPSPDSLLRLLFLPLLIFLTINFLFEKTPQTWFNTILISFLAVFMGLIHLPQLIYYFLILVVFLILLLIFYRDKEILKRIGWLFGGLAVLLAPYLIYLVSKGTISGFLGGTAGGAIEDSYHNKNYLDTNIVYRYAIFLAPVLVLFFKKRPTFIFLFSILFTLLLISWEIFGLRPIFFQYFGGIFVERALGNIPHTLFFGFGLFLIIAGILWLVAKGGKVVLWLVNGILGLFIILLAFSNSWRQTLGDFVEARIFNLKTGFTDSYFWEIFIIITLAILIAYLIGRHFKKEFILPQIKETGTFVIFSLLVILFLSLPYWGGYQRVLAANPNGNLLSNRSSTNASDIRKIGGQETIDFLKYLPHKSVIMTSNTTMSQMVVLYSDQFVAGYPFSEAAEAIYDKITPVFTPASTLDERLKIIKKYQADFLLVQREDENQFFENNPLFFKKVFENHYSYISEEKTGPRTKEITIFVYEYLE